jgi:peptide deformylase
MEVVVYPDPRLLKKTAPITNVTDEVRANAAEMLRLMYEDRGVGLAAPQVGWSARIFVMNPTSDASKPEEETVLLNPKLVKKTGRVKGEEGCLSFPGIYVEVERARDIVIQWTDLDGKPREENWTDWKARIFQHELDHLDNVLLVHRMSPADRIQHAPALDELRRKFQEA